MSDVLPYQGIYSNEVFSVALDNRVYEINIRYNDVDDSYSLQIGRTGFDYLCKVKCLVGQDLLTRYKYLPDIPQGTLEIIDTVGIIGRPTGLPPEGDFGVGKRFRLLYTSEE